MKLNLRLKLALAFTLVAALPLVTLGIIGYLTGRDLARELTLREASSTAELGGELVHHFVGHAREMMTQIALRPALVEAAAPGRWDEATPVLENIQRDTVVFEAVWLVEPDGIRRATSWPDQSQVGMSVADRDYFRGALRTGQPYLSAPYASSRTGEPMVAIAIPVRDAQGRLLALVVGGLPLTQVGDVIAGIRLGQTGHAMLIDSAGVVLAHPGEEFSLESRKGKERLVDAALAGPETGTAQTVNEHSEPALAGWVTIPDIGWRVVVQQPVAEAYAVVEPQNRIMIPVALLAVIFGVAAGLFLANRIAGPVRKAAEAARAVAAGDFSHRIQAGGADEIGELAAAFNTMTARVGELTGQLRATIAELLTPVIPLREGLLAMPLVGAIDTRRAGQITDTLLHEIVRQRARAVILDIGGVPTVDTAVVKHLSETIAAARLMGVQVIVSGISPRVAQTLVELGVEWGDVRTVHNMSQAMEVAYEVVGNRQ